MILDNISKIATEKKIPISKIERDCGISNGTIRKWNDVEPSAVKLKKVADYLKVKVDKLLRDE